MNSHSFFYGQRRMGIEWDFVGSQVTSLLCQSDIIMSCHILVLSGISGTFLNENAKLNFEQGKGSVICVRMLKKNLFLRITICHHSASLVMPNSDPRDRFFYSTLTLMIDAIFFYRML